MKSLTRRGFLKAGCASLAIPCFVPRHVLGVGGVPGANEQLRLGVIGLGGRAGGVVGECAGVPGFNIVAVSDCFAPRIGAFIQGHGKDKGWKGYESFQKMIEEQKPDGVLVETTTHARGWIVVVAMQMGCDVYIEKPMCLSIAEGRYMVRAARKYGRVTQVGTQQRSIPLNNWASDLVKNGHLGKVHTVLAPNFVGPKRWTDKPAAQMPAGTSEGWWNTWTNQAVERPYHPDLQYGWAMFWDYDGGGECFGVTGWGTHSYDQINRGLGTDDTGPTEIVLEEDVSVSNTGKFAKEKRPDDTGVDFHGMAQPVIGPRAKMTMKFASGTQLKLHLDGDSGPGLGAIFVGEKGRIEINRNKISADPADLLAGQAPPEPERGTALHVQDWMGCIKTRARCRADIEIGQRATTLCYLVNIIRDTCKGGQTVHWDPVAERFTDCEAANKLLDRERRKGFELPMLA